jgi:tetratricopeptide (TPR) repeat protein
MYVNDQKYQEALEWVDKYVVNYPDEPNGIFAKSKCYYHIGDKYYAAELYEKACVINPSHEYVNKFEYLGGKPFDILSVAVGNIDYDGDIITERLNEQLKYLADSERCEFADIAEKKIWNPIATRDAVSFAYLLGAKVQKPIYDLAKILFCYV